jgi:diguanylate cyclase (GGDEF)-like protein
MWSQGAWASKLVGGSWLLAWLSFVLGIAAELGLVAMPLLAAMASLLLLLAAVLLREHLLQRRTLLRQGEVIHRLRHVRRQNQRQKEALATLQARLQAQQIELERLRVELSIVDGRTGTPAFASRAMFDRHYRVAWRYAYRERSSLSLVLVEVDQFDALLTQYGEQVGNRCIHGVAGMVQERFRRPSDLVGLFAPGVVAVIAAGADEAAAAQLAEEVRRRVESAGLAVQGVRSRLSVSVGIASLVPDQRHHEAVLLSFADDALYQARAAGGNRCVCYGLPQAMTSGAGEDRRG